MARLEELTRGARVRGLAPGREVTVIDATWHGSTTIDLTFKDDAGQVRSQLLFRTDEPRLEIAAAGSSWNFSADGASFKLAVEAERIRLAWLVDPMLAVNTSNIEPLPHQITAVYDSETSTADARVEATGGGISGTGSERHVGTEPNPEAARVPTRFHASVRVDANRLGREAGKIADEVLSHLSGLVGSHVHVTLEIEADVKKGVPEHVVRTVTENCKTPNFESYGFEER